MNRSLMLWDVTVDRPARDVVIVGDRLNAARWLIEQRPLCDRAERVGGIGGLWGLSAKKIHLVLLPSYRRLRLRRLLWAGVWILRWRGATVERA